MAAPLERLELPGQQVRQVHQVPLQLLDHPLGRSLRALDRLRELARRPEPAREPLAPP